MSKILCIIDGMTDPEFCAGEYPYLSSMELSHVVETAKDCEPESLTCILCLLGIREIPGHLRGYTEALGAGVPVGEDDLVLRGSWFHLDEHGCCTMPCEQPPVPVDCGTYRYYPLGEYKCLLVFPGLAAQVGEIVTHPPCNYAGAEAAQLCPKGSPTLRTAYMEWMQEGLCLIPWGQSAAAHLPPFPQPAAVVCGAGIVKGIARLLGMELVEVVGATGDTDTELGAKTAAALSAAERYPFVLLHINGTDEAAHRLDPAQKKAFLHQVDAVVLSALLASSHEVVVVSDHGTDPNSGLHIGVPQPVFIRKREEFACRKH